MELLLLLLLFLGIFFGMSAAQFPQIGQENSILFLANRRLSSLLQSREPIAPSAGVGKKLMRASKIRRIPHAGCHNSGWKAENDKQTFVFVSNRPDGVKKIILGGLNGYSAGRRIRPWYTPPSNSVSSAPRMVKCHSNISSSKGAAWYLSEGSNANSRISAWIRRKDGDFDMVDIILLLY